MSIPVHLYGALAAHRRGKVLQDTASATPVLNLSDGPAVVVTFAESFQAASPTVQGQMVEWTRSPGHTLLLVPPFAATPCYAPVLWRAERVETPYCGGESMAKILAAQVAHRLTGSLQTPALPGAAWSDLSVAIGTYRLHPAAGLFAVTTLPVCSLSVLDYPKELQAWLARLAALAGEARPVLAPEAVALKPDHFGLLVFLLGKAFPSEEMALANLHTSTIFSMAAGNAITLLRDLQARGLVVGAAPTADGQALVMQSPYAPYVQALREAIR